MNKRKQIVAAVLAACVTVGVFGQSAPDYGAQLSSSLDTVENVWQVVAGLILGVALVKVGARFMKKAG